jgi:hypothetical protein
MQEKEYIKKRDDIVSIYNERFWNKQRKNKLNAKEITNIPSKNRILYRLNNCGKRRMSLNNCYFKCKTKEKSKR